MTSPSILHPCVRDLPGWRDPVELLRRGSVRSRPALLCSGSRHPGLGRYSILAADPYMTLSWTAGIGRVEGPDGTETLASRDPFELLASVAGRARSYSAEPWPFAGGAIGTISYDAGRALEKLPVMSRDDRPFPWVDMAFYAWAINWDHWTGRWAALSTGAPDGRDAGALCDQAAAWALESAGGITTHPTAPAAPWRALKAGSGSPEAEGSLGREEFMAGVRRIRGLITEGECYEVNLTRRIHAPGSIDSVRLFEELLRTNPAPFAAWIRGSRGTLVGSSPERFLRVKGGRAESGPIKGTARRAADPEEDRSAAERLLASEKNRAENVMIVDLVRNDLGRICSPGSVRVDGLCRVESFEGVHHLVSTVSGMIDEGAGPMDVARALFPAGSMTGAPKIRAMEVIEGLEPVRRGPYAGAAGYLSSAGEMDLSVVIRSFLLSARGADLQVGGAVVADSDPAEEYEETVLKAERALKAWRAAAGQEGAGNVEMRGSSVAGGRGRG